MSGMVSAANRNRKEVLVGALLMLVIGYLVYVSLGLGRWRIIERTGYLLYADFLSVAGLEAGATVEIAGVSVGKVESIDLAPDYRARVALRIRDHVTVEQDAVASIGKEGILGSQSITIVPGRSGIALEPGQEIGETESPVSLQDAIGELVAGDLLPVN